MKKNISINISGIIFHIEEDGYETLRKYLDSVNRYFGSFDDSSEILADIESRIAEIFLSRLNDGKQVITAEDVASLMATMGSVSDFKAAEDQEFAASETTRERKQESSSSSSSIPPPKKLFRDTQRQILGGVCAGLANYFNIDPVWPRILFVLLTFALVLPIILYIILWIVLPVSSEPVDESSVKKMFRDPEKKVISGVASGVAAFFGADITLIRLVFIVLIFFGGAGIVLYIVLWIILPEAKTITDRMQMSGEPVTLSNIETTVKKGMNEKDTEESMLARIVLFPFRAIAVVIDGIAKVLGPLFRVLFDILRVAIGLLFTFTGLCMMLALILTVGIMAGIFNAPSWQVFSDWYVSAPNFPISSIRNSIPTWTIIFGFLAAFIPALFVLLLGNSIIAKRIVFRATFGWSMFVLFFVSAGVISFSLPQLLFNFKEEGEYKVEKSFALTGTPVLQVHETGLDDYEVTSLFVKGHEGKEIRIIERFQSQGPSRLVASENAQMVEYNVQQSDSVLSFDSNITFKPEAKFRAQRLDVDILVPLNRPFVIDAALWRMIDTDVIVDSSPYRISLNQETQTWKMTEAGMECVSCPKPEAGSTSGVNDQFGLRDFNSIDLKGLFDVRIEKGDDYAVEIQGPASERKRYDVYVSGETLVINYDDDRKYFWKKNPLDDNTMNVYITMPELRELDVMGAGKVRFSGFDENEVDIKLTGAVMADGQLNASTLNIDLTGASYLDLHGSGRFMDAEILGASGLRAYGYEVSHCIVEAHGASMAKVNVTETLEINKGIASSVSHRGDPEVIRR